MFNVKKKIYVAHHAEYVDMMYERYVMLYPGYEGNEFPSYNDSRINTKQKGMVFYYESVDEMMEKEFGGDMLKFHSFLDKEKDLYIIVNETDYVKLYAWCQSELNATYGVKVDKLRKMLTTQRLKDFMMANGPISEMSVGSVGTVSAIENLWEEEYSMYTPTKKLYSKIIDFPFEVVYALYKWKNITKSQANAKIAVLSRHLLMGQIHNQIESAKLALAADPTIIKTFTGNDSIETIDDIMHAIKDDDFLYRVFCQNVKIDLQDANDLKKIKLLCEIAIDADMDFDSQPEVDKEELHFFFDLYKTKDISIIDNAKFNFLSTGAVATKADKFNSILMITE